MTRRRALSRVQCDTILSQPPYTRTGASALREDGGFYPVAQERVDTTPARLARGTELAVWLQDDARRVDHTLQAHGANRCGTVRRPHSATGLVPLRRLGATLQVAGARRDLRADGVSRCGNDVPAADLRRAGHAVDPGAGQAAARRRAHLAGPAADLHRLDGPASVLLGAGRRGPEPAAVPARQGAGGLRYPRDAAHQRPRRAGQVSAARRGRLG